MKAVILAAGRGSRLRSVVPKTLTRLSTDETILGRLLSELPDHMRIHDVLVVVGYGAQLVMDTYPDVTFVYNPAFATTNTASSLLRALQRVDDDVITLNGDLVLRPGLLGRLVSAGRSGMLVTTGSVADEEMKYQLDADGCICAVSKEVRGGLGEAVGANVIARADIPRVIEGLRRCTDRDYFERGFEHAIAAGVRFVPIHADANDCIEVDFPADLSRSAELLRSWT